MKKGGINIPKRVFRNTKAFTLIELIISLSLIATVLLLAYTFYFFGVRTFETGERQSNLQRDIRRAADFVTNEVRNAVELSFVDSCTLGDGYLYIFLESSTITHCDGYGNKTYITRAVITDLFIGLKKVKDKYVLEFLIKGDDGNQIYELSSDVLLNNVTGCILTQNKSVIKYKKP